MPNQMAPSWKIHRMIGEKLLSYYNYEIDEIIDSELSHDVSRYDVSKLAEVVKTIKNRFGEDGLRYMILHHYLDRLCGYVDILISEIVSLFDIYSPHSMDYFNDELARFEQNILDRLNSDPANILNLIVEDYRVLLVSAEAYYSGKGKRVKKKEVIERLSKAYVDLNRYQELKELTKLAPLIRDIRSKITREIRSIILSILYEDDKIDDKVANAIRMKVASWAYRYGDHVVEEYTKRFQQFIETFFEYITEPKC